MVSMQQDPRGDGAPEGRGDQSESEAVERLIELLEFEVGRIRAEESQSGWTTWALLGSLATILWLLSLTLEAHTIDIRNTLLLLLGFSLLWDCLTRWLPGLIAPELSKSTPRLQFARSVLGQARSWTLVELARSGALMAVAAMIRPFAGTAVVAAIYLFYGAYVLMCLLVLIMSFLRWPLPTNGAKGWPVRVLAAVLLGLGAVSLWGLLSALWTSSIAPALCEYRVAGLLLAAIVTLQILARVRRRTPLLDSLVQIRRSLGLRRMNSGSATQQTEIALAGMTLADAVQDDLRELLSLAAQASASLDAFAKELEALSSALGHDVTQVPEGQLSLLKAVMRSAKAHVDDALDSQAGFGDGLDRFTRRVLLLQRVVPGSGQHVQVLGEMLAAANQDIGEKGVRAEAELARFGELMDSSAASAKAELGRLSELMANSADEEGGPAQAS